MVGCMPIISLLENKFATINKTGQKRNDRFLKVNLRIKDGTFKEYIPDSSFKMALSHEFMNNYEDLVFKNRFTDACIGDFEPYYLLYLAGINIYIVIEVDVPYR